MSGRHARHPWPARALRRLRAIPRPGRRGLAEIATVLVLGVALPLAAFLSLPHFFDAGNAMVAAPTCASDATDTSHCLLAVPTVAARHEGAVADRWSFALGHPMDPDGRGVTDDGTRVALSFPRFGTSIDPGSTGHVLFWHGDAVAFTGLDGRVVDSLEWGRLYTVSFRLLVLVPVWVVTAAILARLVVSRRESSTALVLAIVAVGAVAAAPSAWLGLQLYGLRGLVTGGIVPLGISLVLAGLAVARRQRRLRALAALRAGRAPAVGTIPAQPRLDRIPTQRSFAGDVDSADDIGADR